MTKEEKRAEEAKKPLEERNYWHLNKQEKNAWLLKKDLKKWNDVTLPILTPFLGVVVMLLGLVFLILTMRATGGFLTKNKPLMYACCGVITAIGLGVCIWMIFRMKKEATGFWINDHVKTDKSMAQRGQEEIERDDQVISSSNPTNEEPIDLDL